MADPYRRKLLSAYKKEWYKANREKVLAAANDRYYRKWLGLPTTKVGLQEYIEQCKQREYERKHKKNSQPPSE